MLRPETHLTDRTGRPQPLTPGATVVRELFVSMVFQQGSLTMPTEPERLTRRTFAASMTVLSLTGVAMSADDKPRPPKDDKPEAKPEFERDYPAPKFQPSMKKPQLPKLMVQDFVIYAHSELDMVKLLLEKEPKLLNATMDWGGGDWETGLGAASHMGRRDIAEYLIERGARIDLFAAAMIGQLDVVKTFLTFQPKLIDATGPHGFSLHHHAKMGGKAAEPVLSYLTAIKPAPAMKGPAPKAGNAPTKTPPKPGE